MFQSLHPVVLSQRKNVVKIDFNLESHRDSIESCKTDVISDKTFIVPAFHPQDASEREKDAWTLTRFVQ